MRVTEKEIIEDLKGNCNLAFGQLYKEHFAMVLNHIERNSGNKEDAEDVFQDTLLILCEKIQQKNFQLTASLKTYIMAIAKNIWFKKLHLEKNENKLKETFILEFWEAISEEESEEEIEKSTFSKIESIFKSLTDGCIKLLTDLYLLGKSFLNIKEENDYKNIHTVQNMKYKCISELPRYDFLLMIKESINRDKFSNAELSQILTDIANKIGKTP